LHVVREPPRLGRAYQRGYTPEQVVHAAIVEVKRLLENLAAEATNWNVKIVWRVCRGEEFRESGAVASREAVDLIVMGTQGQTGLA